MGKTDDANLNRLQKEGLNKVIHNVSVLFWNGTGETIIGVKKKEAFPSEVLLGVNNDSVLSNECFHQLSGDEPPYKMAQGTSRERSCQVPRHLPVLQKHFSICT